MVNLKTDYNEIQEEIDKARKWALKHFNAEECHNEKLVNDDLSLVKPSFFVEFPSLDTMKVAPSLMGQKSYISVTYRVAFNPLEWHGRNPVTGSSFPPLRVE